MFHIRIELRRQFHALAVFTQADIGYFADIHAQYANHRVIDFDAVRTVKIQRDFRPCVADVVEQQPAAHQEGNQRHQPDKRRESIRFSDTGRNRRQGLIGHNAV